MEVPMRSRASRESPSTWDPCQMLTRPREEFPFERLAVHHGPPITRVADLEYGGCLGLFLIRLTKKPSLQSRVSTASVPQILSQSHTSLLSLSDVWRSREFRSDFLLCSAGVRTKD